MNTIPVHNIEDQPAAMDATKCPSLHIASLIAHVRQCSVAKVANWLEQQPRVEIHAQSPEEKFTVVMEADHEQGVLAPLDDLGQRPGVISTALIYHEVIEEEEGGR